MLMKVDWGNTYFLTGNSSRADSVDRISRTQGDDRESKYDSCILYHNLIGGYMDAQRQCAVKLLYQPA